MLIYLSVASVSGAVIALQIVIMRIFAVGSWAHFGSMVVSLAMMSFGITSVVMCAASGWFEHRGWTLATIALFLFGPLLIASNLLAQQIPFNAIFLISDPAQKWRLYGNLALYLLPFTAGALFLGCVFLKARAHFARVYFADLAGAGLGGLVTLASLYVLLPENLLLVPLGLWLLGSLLWIALRPGRASLATLAIAALSAILLQEAAPRLLGATTLAVSDYKGVAYARKFPDSRLVYENASPFGLLQVYSSSYLHFAPGLSDNAAFNLPEMPANAYLGMYIDGDGPFGIIRNLSEAEEAYFSFLPMVYPYVIKGKPDTFVVQFGGGISTAVALRYSAHVTVAEANPAILQAFRDDLEIRDFTGSVLRNSKVSVVDYDGRLFLAHSPRTYDVVDLSLADSTGLSSPGGFAIAEKYAYTREAMESYMRALAPGGVLSVTLWNKEEPPKSILKLYATMAEAARAVDPASIADRFFVVSSYLSTTTVLYKQGGFTQAEIAQLHDHTRAMSFDEVYFPGLQFDSKQIQPTLESYRNSIFDRPSAAPASSPSTQDVGPDAPTVDSNPAGDAPGQLPSTTMGQIAWNALVHGGWNDVATDYVFDARSLSNDRPYFAAYVKPADLLKVTDRLDLFQDEWGYLLVWATFLIAIVAASMLIAIPVMVGWRSDLGRYRGLLRTIVYFGCLGLGYIMVEVALIAKFVVPLGNPTISASILITAMLVFSGIGSLVSERIADVARIALPAILLAIGLLLIAYAWWLDPFLGRIGAMSYGLRILCCFALVAPPAFLMGFPMATAMTWLSRLGKESVFIWAWGINGAMSVVGAAAVPIVATAFGLSTVLTISGVAYLVAILAFRAIFLSPKRSQIALSAKTI
ncbi:hypothetical protein GCM10007874_39650 [Labrys miyagiensis]|uniref:Spermidine synthase n=1 Tax=Labrys miyagiensis TaxID=346912 RepID=A0ABQ6CME5_9HYPH|nr:hypothetical protein [Labrys miyagiensis]GLS20948.1 hypothetical protein GCM10007874_39650 [Labrys miyagiensis]